MFEKIQQGRTCTTCVRARLSANTAKCVDCLKNDVPGNRFPNWEKKE